VNTETLHIRPLVFGDFDKGFFDVLSALSDVGEPNRDDFCSALDTEMRDTRVRTVVAVSDGEIVGTARLFFEQKFSHGLGVVAHVEDVAVHPKHQGNGVGRALVTHLLSVARVQPRCYKAVLSAAAKNIPFYKKFGFYEHEMEMRLDLR
jgi:glucosamine-phosphate N-acetyltransferase